MWPREACLGLRVQKFSPVFYRTLSPSDPLPKKERKWEEEVEEEDKEEERRVERRQKGGKGKVKRGERKGVDRRKGRGGQSTSTETTFTIFSGWQ